jgi:Arc/MetJ family transcription regulator
MGRTNIVIDDELVGIVMQRYRLRTKTDAVDMALRYLADRPMSREEILAMRGANLIGGVPEDRFDHDPR